MQKSQAKEPNPTKQDLNGYVPRCSYSEIQE